MYAPTIMKALSVLDTFALYDPFFPFLQKEGDPLLPKGPPPFLGILSDIESIRATSTSESLHTPTFHSYCSRIHERSHLIHRYNRLELRKICLLPSILTYRSASENMCSSQHHTKRSLLDTTFAGFPDLYHHQSTIQTVQNRFRGRMEGLTSKINCLKRPQVYS